MQVDYDATGPTAVLSADGAGAAPGFVEVRRRLLEHAEINTVATGVIRVPWYIFLRERRSIGIIARQYTEPVQISDAARTLLQEAADFDAEFGRVPDEVSTDDLVERLAANGFQRRLESYQTRNVAQLIARTGAASFSVPGAGKTTEALAAFAYTRDVNPLLLVIAPRNALVAWEKQWRLCFPTDAQAPRRLVGGDRAIKSALAEKPSIMLTTYGQIIREPAGSAIVAYIEERRHGAFVIADESHTFKNTASRARAALMRLAPLPARRLILSGTPVPNALSDLVPQFEFLFPGVAVTDRNVDSRFQGRFVRTRKNELNIGEIERRKIILPMSPEHRRVYSLVSSSQARQLEASLSLPVRARLARAGASAQRLLQLTTDPVLALDALEDAIGRELMPLLTAAGAPKIEWACNRARALAMAGKKCVIWSNFVRVVEVIAERLEDLGAVYIHGAVGVGDDEDDETREGRVRRFHEDSGCFVLVANPLAAAEGISLHEAAQFAIYVDRNYNVAKYLQSEDRIHRLGLPPGSTPVIEYLFHERTIDESVERRLKLKIGRMAALLDDPDLKIDAALGSTDVFDGLTIEDTNDLLAELKAEQ